MSSQSPTRGERETDIARASADAALAASRAMPYGLSNINGTKRYLAENALLFVITATVCGFLSWKTRHFQLDDALIYLRYLRNFFDGNGLVYNVGDRFNGLTSPLYSYLLIAANTAIQNLQATTVLISGLFLFCASAAGSNLMASGTRMGKLLCGLFVVSFNYFYLTFGMETSLFLFLSALALLCYRRESYFGLGVTLGLLFLTRSEGVFLGLVIVADYIIRHRKLPHVRYIAAPVLLIGANFLFNYFYYGAFLPATGGAKIGQGKSGFWGTGLIFLNIEYMYGWVFGNSSRMLWFLIPSCLLGVAMSWRERTTWLVLAYLALLGGFYTIANIPNYHWYYAPFYYFALLFSATGAWHAIARTAQLPVGRVTGIAIGVAAALATAWFVQHSFRLANVERGPMDAYKNIGNWIKHNTPPDSVLAAVEIGTVGWYSERYLVDILGLTNRYNADYIAKKDVNSWLGKYRPDYILVHVPLWSFEASANCLLTKQAYREVDSFQFQGYKLLQKVAVADVDARIEQCAHVAA